MDGFFSPYTRSRFAPSPDYLNVSMDFNAAPSGTARGTEVIIPDNAPPAVRAAAEAFNQRVAEFARRNGIEDYPIRGVRTRTENGRGVPYTIHAEPFFNSDLAMSQAIAANPAEFAAIYQEAFGGLPGARAIAPHGVGRDRGAASDIFGDETSFGELLAKAAMGEDYVLPQILSTNGPSQDIADETMAVLGLSPMSNQPSAPAGRTDSTISTRGPEPMQEYEPEKAGGILGMLFPKMTADRQDSIALALSGLGRGNPALEANLRDRMGGRRDDRKEFEQQQHQQAQVNRTRDFVLRQVQNGNLPPVFAEMAQADPVGAFQAATQRLTAGEQPTYQQVRGSDLGLTGPQADMMFNRAPDGKITQVGGGGTVVNNNMGGGKFEEAFAKGDADTIGSVYNTGLQASRNMARIGELDTLLQSAPSGAEGALKLAAGQIGINTEGLGELQAAQAIINSLVPEQRQPGSGPMSDADLNLFKQSLPRIINQPGGNAMIIGTMQRIAEYDMQGAQIVQALRSGEIDRAEAFQRLQSRADPLGDVRGSFGSGGQNGAVEAPTDDVNNIPTFNPETGAWE